MMRVLVASKRFRLLNLIGRLQSKFSKKQDE